jgi:ectoine hydroxylase-related dioxygenase (phytanoyl-CoA dioxygenase family)
MSNDRARGGGDAAARQRYLAEGTERALAMDNRGPVRFGAGGRLLPEILEAYHRLGFYVFRDVLSADELADMEADLQQVLARLPAHRGDALDPAGRPALGADCEAPTLFWSKPLGDPFGGTAEAGGRHPVKMSEPEPDVDAPEEVVFLILGPLQFSDAFLRLYGNPDLLAVAASVNGEDFVPFNEALFIKAPGLGASVAWHQDGLTHWDNPDWDEDIHGFNFMAQLYGSTAANGVWVVPGSHKLGKADIAARVAEVGCDRLPDAVPLITEPGDVVICNRQIVHGSFANVSERWRVTFNMGFHRRSSVLGVRGGGLHNAPAVYDAGRIARRARLIGYGIDARRQRFPQEAPFRYRPLEAAGEHHMWNDRARADLHDYNLLDLSI